MVVFDDGRLVARPRPSTADGRHRAGPSQPAAHAPTSSSGTSPSTLHAVVEIDQDRPGGDPDLVAVDDCGTVINLLLAAGQVHGGLAQGIAQMLFEEALRRRRQPAHGDPHHAVPSAAEPTRFRTAHTVTTTPKNPLAPRERRIRTTGSISAWNAGSTRSPLGIHHLDLPFTLMRVWRRCATPR